MSTVTFIELVYPCSATWGGTSVAGLEKALGILNFAGEGFFVREFEAVFGGEDFVGEIVEGVFGDGGVFVGAENEADGWIFAGFHPMFAGVVEVKVHLAGIGVGEGTDFEIDDDQAIELAMKEEEIDAEPLIADAQTALAADECEVVAEFEEEGLEMGDQGVFEFGFGVFVLEAEEFEDEGVFDLLFRGKKVAGRFFVALDEHGGFIFGEKGAFVEEGIDLAVELADGPSAAEGFGFVEGAGLRIFQGKQTNIVRPGKGKKDCWRGGRFRRQCLRN